MFRYLPPATRAILLTNVFVFLGEQVIPGALDGPFALRPLGAGFEPWQLVTYAFLHNGFTHIFFNMFAFFMFSPMLEELWGTGRFTAVYFASVLTAALAQLVTVGVSGSTEATVGASGGVFGLLLAFALYFPRRKLFLIPIPIPIPAWLFVTIYGLLELFLGVTHSEAGVAHFAHLGGMLGAALVMLYWRLQAQPR